MKDDFENLQLKADDLSLKATSENDPELNEMVTRPEILPYMTELKVPGNDRPNSLVMRIEVKGKLAGELALRNVRWINRKAELSIFLMPDFQHQHLARRVFRLIADYLFFYLDFHRLEAEVFAYNERALKLVRSLGFIQEGVLREARWFDGRFRDIIRFGLLRHEYERESRHE